MNKVYILLVFSVLFAERVSSQEIDTKFPLQILTAEGILLDKGWKFHAGDNFSWIGTDYNDSGWTPINPLKYLDELPEVKQAGIGWFRLNLLVDTLLRNKTLGIIISSMGAAEIYLNGQSVYKVGRAHVEYEKEQTRVYYSRAFSINLGSDAFQSIAVRYSFNKENLYVKAGYIPPCFKMLVNRSNETLKNYASSKSFLSTLIAICQTIILTLGLFTLYFQISFPSRKEYLYFTAFFFCQFINILLQTITTSSFDFLTVNKFGILVLVANLPLVASSIFLLTGVFLLYKERKTKFYYFLIGYAVVSVPLILCFPEWGGLLAIFYFPLTCFEFLRLSYKAARYKKPGAWILFCSILLTLLAEIGLIGALVNANFNLGIILIAVAFVIPSVGLSLLLAGDFAYTSSTLQLRLLEVRQLSQKNIAQEKEKQELLTFQNETLEKQVAERTSDLEKSLHDLKSTQAQLIQSEKMASLGELTAGIAHEIQNPLNFVNNFSEINRELLVEMRQEISNKNYQEVDDLAKDIEDNERKINEHGKRAESIVKGMLLHSRTSSGAKEPTDINKQADEFLRLSYHGFRAKDKAFNVVMETDYGQSIGSVNVVPQEIGRVLLNLFNNAFYAVNEKKKQQDGYEPVVSVSTQKAINKVIISIKDNGNGIPQKVVDKIFQPFFTTKPTGQGTGLGLSLAYDIIKAHSGEINVITEQGEGSEFIIQLPVVES